MNLTVMNRGSKKPERVVATMCCWWVTIAVLFDKKKRA